MDTIMNPIPELKEAVVIAAVKEIQSRWENLGAVIMAKPKSALKARKLAVATASMELSDAVDALLAAQIQQAKLDEQGRLDAEAWR